jgi:hypothetical protein
MTSVEKSLFGAIETKADEGSIETSSAFLCRCQQLPRSKQRKGAIISIIKAQMH